MLRLMSSRTKKTVCLYSLLILSTIQSTCHSQPIVGNKMYPAAPPYTPTGHSQAIHAPKGYTSTQVMDPLYAQQFHSQYWTGNRLTHYPQYPGYQQYGYQPYGGYDPYGMPSGSQFYPQHAWYPDAGYNAYHGQYPAFNANYWMGGSYYPHGYYPQPYPVYPAYPQYPVYPHPGHYPIYHQQPYYHHYPYHPYPYRHYDDGKIFGMHKHTLAKGVIGAVLAGVVAGKVAQRGK